MNIMLITKVIAPTSINVKNGTLSRNKLLNATLLMTILVQSYNQKRKL